MEDNLLISYQDGEVSGFDLGLLGESFTGMNALLKDISSTMGIQGEITLKTTQITHGSIDIHNAILVTIPTIPFHSPSALYEFLQVASPDMLREAKEFLSGALGVHRSLNDYFQTHPFDNEVLSGLTVAFILAAVQWASKQKDHVTTRDSELGEISPRQAKRFRKLVLTGRFRRALKPIREGSVNTIKLQAVNIPNASSVTIQETNLGDLLPDDDRILPDFVNGNTYSLTGRLVSLESTRGEVLKIKLDNVDRAYSLVTAHPQDGETTADFTQFYKQRVTFEAEAVRRSMYKRPEFVIQAMELAQEQTQLLD
ncbi:MAG TPA: hypothetical protein VJR27_03250 [Candidatus Saccharimonadales bacterium]|nr:hypothetical protein [Candidatus Saccharimonadales bacterium]